MFFIKLIFITIIKKFKSTSLVLVGEVDVLACCCDSSSLFLDNYYFLNSLIVLLCEIFLLVMILSMSIEEGPSSTSAIRTKFSLCSSPNSAHELSVSLLSDPTLHIARKALTFFFCTHQSLCLGLHSYLPLPSLFFR
jgi:hypothetical protein